MICYRSKVSRDMLRSLLQCKSSEKTDGSNDYKKLSQCYRPCIVEDDDCVAFAGQCCESLVLQLISSVKLQVKGNINTCCYGYCKKRKKKVAREWVMKTWKAREEGESLDTGHFCPVIHGNSFNSTHSTVKYHNETKERGEWPRSDRVRNWH